MAKYHGKTGVVYASTTGSGTAINVGNMSGFSLDASTDTVDVTAFGDTNKTYVIGLANFAGTIEGFWADDDTTLKTASLSSDGTKLYLYPSSNAVTKYVYGPAFISFQLRTGVAQAVTMSVNFTARGSWGNNL